jgi:hypothetical protein
MGSSLEINEPPSLPRREWEKKTVHRADVWTSYA